MIGANINNLRGETISRMDKLSDEMREDRRVADARTDADRRAADARIDRLVEVVTGTARRICAPST